MKFSDIVLVTDYDHGMISSKTQILFHNKKKYFCQMPKLMLQI